MRRAAVGILVLALIPLSIPAAADEPADLVAAVTETVTRQMDSVGVEGVGVALIDEFEVVWVGSFGVAEPGRPIEPTTLFQAASLTKPMSAVVAAAAAEDGLVDLDADIFNMLVSWQHPPMPFGDVPVTLHQLFAHRGGANVSGFPGYRQDETLPTPVAILDGILDKNEPIRIYAEPGTEKSYSGGGFVMAQVAMEDHIGITFESLAEQLVFEPLGLVHSTYRILEAADRQRVAVGYRADGSEIAGGGWHLYPETAPASLWTTPTEYAEFVIDVMRSHIGDVGVVLDQATAEYLLDPLYPVGFGLSAHSDVTYIGHEGANEGYRTQFLAVVERGEGIVVLTNNDAGLELTQAVVDTAADEFGWPKQWSTPLWVVLIGFVFLAVIVVGVWLLFLTLRRRSAGA